MYTAYTKFSRFCRFLALFGFRLLRHSLKRHRPESQTLLQGVRNPASEGQEAETLETTSSANLPFRVVNR